MHCVVLCYVSDHSTVMGWWISAHSDCLGGELVSPWTIAGALYGISNYNYSYRDHCAYLRRRMYTIRKHQVDNSKPPEIKIATYIINLLIMKMKMKFIYFYYLNFHRSECCFSVVVCLFVACSVHMLSGSTDVWVSLLSPQPLPPWSPSRFDFNHLKWTKRLNK